MNRVDKQILAALLNQTAVARSQEDDKPVDLDALLPEPTPAMAALQPNYKNSLKWQFLTDYLFWYQDNRDATLNADAFFANPVVTNAQLRDYLTAQLLALDSDLPESGLPSIAQVGWVFEKLMENARGQGTYRSLIYGLMGFDESAYGALLSCGGMTVHNAVYCELNPLQLGISLPEPGTPI